MAKNNYHNHEQPIIEAKEIAVAYRQGSLIAHRSNVLESVNLTLSPGKSLGVIGPSGSGKTTLALACAGLLKPHLGTVHHDGVDVYRKRAMKKGGTQFAVQMVFQNPFAALNPRRSIGGWLSKILKCKGQAECVTPAKLEAFLEPVRLPKRVLDTLPGQLSGGECQRACIAACFAAGARALILDEPLSMLDPIAQEEVLDVLMSFQKAHTWAYLLLSHDLSLVSRLCDVVLVLVDGQIVESAPPPELLANPQHPVTQEMVEALSLEQMERTYF